MEKIFNVPPKNPRDVMTANDLALCLKNLIGKSVKITGKPRTDGSTIRKLVTDLNQETILQKVLIMQLN